MKLLTLPLALVVSGSALAQMGGQIPPNETQGFLTGTPIGVQHVKENVLLLRDGRPKLRLRTETVANGQLDPFPSPPLGTPGPGNPDYSGEELFAWIAAYGLDPLDPLDYPELGGMSTGGDVTPQVDSEGSLLMNLATGTTWLHTTVSVDKYARGQAESLIARPGAGSSDLYSYVAEGSIGIDPEFVDQVRIEYTTDQMHLPTTNRGVNAIDWGMGLISRTPDGEPTQLQPERNLFYFSVRKWWLDEHPNIGMDPWRIYVMEWTGAGWTAPDVAFTKAELFGGAAILLGGDAEIDALSVWKGNGSHLLPDRVTFSMTPRSWVSAANRLGEILVAQRMPYPVQGKDLRTERPDPIGPASEDNRGILITEKLGLDLVGPAGGDPDNVDGVCNKDPNEAFRLDLNLALPMPEQPGNPTSTLGFAMLRDGVFDASAGSDADDRGDLLMQAHGVDLQPGEIAALTYELEVYEKDKTLPSLTSSGTVPVFLGDDQPHLFGPLTVDLSNRPPGTEFSLRGRVTMMVFDVSTLIPLSYHESWWSELQLTR